MLSKKTYFGLGKVPVGVGAVIKGWDISEEEFRSKNSLPVVDFRAMTGDCPHDCFHCFTNKSKKTITIEEINSVIDQLATLNTKAIDFLGEGEPTIDKDFFDIVEYTFLKGIQPIVFTDAATMLRNRKFVDRLYKSGASVCTKCDSLWNAEYQNWVVGDKSEKFFDQRNEALKIMIERGFNAVAKDGTTRLGFDMVVSKKNMHEVERTLRFCRENNIWVIFSFFLPVGRSGTVNFDKSLMLNLKEKRKIKGVVEKVDEEFGFKHDSKNNFLTSNCIEFMCIYGNGNVSPCVGNETIVGSIKTHSVKELIHIIMEKFPRHNLLKFDGYCCYREKF